MFDLQNSTTHKITLPFNVSVIYQRVITKNDQILPIPREKLTGTRQNFAALKYEKKMDKKTKSI